MKKTKISSIEDLGLGLGLSKERAALSKMKTEIKKHIINEALKEGINHTDLAKLSGLSRSVVSGILNGSLQSVTVDRLVRLAMALDLTVSIRIKKAA